MEPDHKPDSRRLGYLLAIIVGAALAVVAASGVQDALNRPDFALGGQVVKASTDWGQVIQAGVFVAIGVALIVVGVRGVRSLQSAAPDDHGT